MKSIGIKLADGSFYPIISEGETQKKTLDVTTVKDNQTTVQIDLYRSESDSMDDAEYVDSLEIKNLKPHPNGEPNLHLELSLDDENKLQAKVRDPETGKISSTKVALVSRTLEERSEPANFALGTTPEAQEAEKSLLESSNDEDFSFDTLSDSKTSDEIPTEGFLSDSQVLSDNMISDSPLTDSDMLSPEDLFYDNDSEIKEIDNTIVDRDGTSFTFENETPEITADPPAEEPADKESDDEMENLFEGINADNFVTIDGSEHTGENGFEVPEEFADLGSGDDFSIPPVEEEIDDTPGNETVTKESSGTTDADSVPAFDIPPLFDDSLFDETRAEGTVTSAEDFGTPSEPEDLSSDAGIPAEAESTGDDLDKVMENPFPEVDLSDIDDGTETAAKEKETNYDLPSFDELGTDAGSTDNIAPVPDALPSSTNDVMETVIPETQESENLDLDLPDFDDLETKESTGGAETVESNPDTEATLEEKTGEIKSPDLDLPDFNDLPDFDTGTESSASDNFDFTLPAPKEEEPGDTDDKWTETDTAGAVSAGASSSASLDLPDFDDIETSRTTPDDLPDFGDPFSTLSSPTSHTDFELPDFDDSPAKRDLDKETSDFFENFDSNYPNQADGSDSSDAFDDGFDDAFDSDDASKYGYEEDESKKKKSKSRILLVAALACLILALLLFTVPNLLKNKNNPEIASSGESNPENTIAESNVSKQAEDISESSYESTDSASKSDADEIMDKPSTKKSAEKKSSRDKNSSAKKSGSKKTTTVSAKDKKSEETAQSSKTAQGTQILPEPQVEKVTGPAAHTMTSKKTGQSTGNQIAAREDTIVVVRTPESVVPVPPRRSDNSPTDIKYKISRGDTLWDISKAYYKTPWNYERIAEYNGITNPDFIRAGQTILLPVE